MKKRITIEVPEEWLAEVQNVTSEVWEEILQLGLRQYKIKHALSMYRAGEGSLGYIAEKMGLPKEELIKAARQAGIEPEFDEEMVREEVAS